MTQKKRKLRFIRLACLTARADQPFIPQPLWVLPIKPSGER